VQLYPIMSCTDRNLTSLHTHSAVQRELRAQTNQRNSRDFVYPAVRLGERGTEAIMVMSIIAIARGGYCGGDWCR
jgi:hypothetical protein